MEGVWYKGRTSKDFKTEAMGGEFQDNLSLEIVTDFDESLQDLSIPLNPRRPSRSNLFLCSEPGC